MRTPTSLRWMSQFHVWIFRATSGAVGSWLAPNLWSAWSIPICLLTTTGAKSGLQRTTPLAYVADGENVILIASQGGMPTHPLWYTNMLANPMVEIETRGRKQRMKVRTANPAERAKWWPEAVKVYAGYAGYQKKTDREIPVVICEPA